MIDYLKLHKLVWIVPLVLVPLVIGAVAYLAKVESQTPDSPFIYDL